MAKLNLYPLYKKVRKCLPLTSINQRNWVVTCFTCFFFCLQLAAQSRWVQQSCCTSRARNLPFNYKRIWHTTGTGLALLSLLESALSNCRDRDEQTSPHDFLRVNVSNWDFHNSDTFAANGPLKVRLQGLSIAGSAKHRVVPNVSRSGYLKHKNH